MEVLRNLYRDQLTEAPKRASQVERTGYSKELGWIFVCHEFTQPRAIRTYRSLFGAKEKYTYFTPNTFYRNDQRHAGSLRWLNAMVIDIDVKTSQNAGMIFPDVMDRVTSAGLPTPSLVVQTPSGGFHVYWYLKEPRRAFPKVVDHYKRVQRMIAEEMNADLQAIGAERWFRLPTEENTVFRSGERVSFDDLCDWLTEQQGNQSKKGKVALGSTDLLSHPAILKLLEGVEEGQRDNTCYTLALAYKAAGYEEDQALSSLYYWNEKNSPSLRQIEIKRKVKSAFKPGSPLGPSSYWIEMLSGIEFKYQVWETAKLREERKYSHLTEWIEDILILLRQNKGCIRGSQRELAKMVTSSVDSTKRLSYTSFKRLIEELVDQGIVCKSVSGKGRGAVTTIQLVSKDNLVMLGNLRFKKNGPNSNTFIDKVVGGSFTVPTVCEISPLIYFDIFRRGS
ncbi:primase C-terminal domain-containing protein [Exiguobacterium aestuarii]|uniref:Primase C-terminal domain-containing protein n=1 Tax=Exiguobacterium aestuarii TaxID=273527 RepID=A0ABW2PT32_9BACL|nr:MULTISPECIES: primase C-terminal domain-containing protein [Exiguobacterium]MCT4787142.1 primase C-terminal domain-containing protein [Exiguobacterium aestuarii]